MDPNAPGREGAAVYQLSKNSFTEQHCALEAGIVALRIEIPPADLSASAARGMHEAPRSNRPWFSCLPPVRPPNIPRPVRLRFLAPFIAFLFRLRCHVGRDYDPVKGQWFEDLEENEIFQVVSVDPDEEIIEIQYENGDIEEIDLDTWHELDLERTTEPEGWVSDESGDDDEEEEDVEEEDEDWDEDDEDEDDDWDDDEDEDLDDDYSDRDDN